MLLLVGMVILAVSTTGCEPLRKKFVRQKKKSAEGSGFVPVLDPIDYPDRVVDAGQRYRYYASMWQVWLRDLLTVLDEGGSDKRISYLLNQSYVQLEEMAKLLTGPKLEELRKSMRELQQLQETMKLPAAMRDDTGMKRRLQTIDKNVRMKFRFEDVKDQLVQL
jgi:hypothetical protein